MLLIINNGLPAICLSSISAVLLSVALWVVRSPTISAEERVVAATFQEQYHVIVASEQPAGVASNVLGLLVVALTLVFWRSRKTVFLDRVSGLVLRIRCWKTRALLPANFQDTRLQASPENAAQVLG